MDKATAQKLVRETLQSSFNKEGFVYLIKNILKHIEDAPFTYKGNLIFDDFADSIRLVERVGKYKGPDEKLVDILIIHLQKEISLERARTRQRNFVAKYLNGSRGGILKDAALVAFVPPSGEDWRFSFVKMEYQFKETPQGKIKVEEEFTPARRYSFLVGKNENSHTAQSRLLPLLLNDETPPTLEDLENAFSVEKVTKEFFEKYRDLFLRFKEALDEIVKKDAKVRADFQTKNVDLVVFAKKLLGQIVFLYFLQKKGWLGAKEKFGDGDKNFLRNLFERAKKEKKNFFNDYLEFLFYDALNNERRNSADPSYHPYFRCKVPFLNGGLFEPLGNYDWKNTNIALPNELFSNNFETKQGDKGTGVLDIFDRFNFTVKEDEPLDKEVAIDPELLGRLYEKFNAITSDNFSEYLQIIKSGKKGEETKFNKQYGVYYTPPEIVQYMCRESLINYLASKFEGKINKSDFEKLVNNASQILENEKTAIIKEQEIKQGKIEKTDYKFKTPLSIRSYAKEIDEALAKIKVCDPAVGSGAFPIGMMNQIVNIRELLSVLLKTSKSRYDLKLECIENSLYGVDIDPGAVEICKLRFWLSLVVEEERLDIKPLPNLDYKVMQGNSLLEEYEGIKLFDKSLLYSQLPDETEIEDLKQHKSKIEKQLLEFYQQNPRWMNDKKIEKPEKLLALEKEHERIVLVLKDKEKFKTLDSQIPNLFGEEKRSKKIWEKLKELQHKYFSTFDESKLLIKKEIENLTWKLIEETLVENNQESKVSEIQKIKESGKKPFFIWELNFPEVFANNNKPSGFDIVIANPPYVDYRKIDSATKSGLLRYKSSQKTRMGNLYIYFIELGVGISGQLGTVCYINPHQFLTSDSTLGLREFLIKHTSILRIVDLSDLKIFESASVYTSINFFTPHIIEKNKIQIIRPTTIDELDLVEFNLDQDKISRDPNLMIILNKDLELLEKVEANAKKLGSFCTIFVGSSSTGLRRISEKEFIRLGNKRNKFCSFIQSSNVQRYFFERKNTQYVAKNGYPREVKERFLKEKIILARMTKDIRASYSNVEEYAGKVNILVDFKINPKYILGLLNSRLINFWYKSKFESRHLAGGYLGFDIPSVKSIPIKTSNLQQSISNLVDKILAITKNDDYLQNPAKQTKVREYEKQIDQMVYRLYGLTSEEIGVVEKNS